MMVPPMMSMMPPPGMPSMPFVPIPGMPGMPGMPPMHPGMAGMHGMHGIHGMHGMSLPGLILTFVSYIFRKFLDNPNDYTSIFTFYRNASNDARVRLFFLIIFPQDKQILAIFAKVKLEKIYRFSK